MEASPALIEPHPLLPLPTRQQAEALIAQYGREEGERRLLEILTKRREMIDAERDDPYRHGYEPFCWKDSDALLAEASELLIQGGNRSSKSRYAARTAMKTMCERTDRIVWCLHSTHTSSVEMQHPLLYEYIPLNWKKIPQRTKACHINYTIKNGFSGDKFVLPNGSQCIFKNYCQDVKVIEGGEPDFIWCDELVPLNWIETLRYRIMTRKGRLLITFTPVTGYSPVVRHYVAGSRILRTLPVDYVQPELAWSRKVEPLLAKDQIHVRGCPPGEMPYVLRCARENARVIYYFGQFNPYSPYDELVKTCKGVSTIEIKQRAFGWAENVADAPFPRFGEQNIVPHERVPKEGTNYMVVDPAGARNWFMIWARVVNGPDGRPQIFIYREWPDQSFGEWALEGEKPDGRRGPAQTSGAGRGIIEYKHLIRDLEGKEQVFQRYIDPRAGTQAVQAEEQGTSVIDMMAQDHPGCPAMVFVPSVAKGIDEGVALINSWLAWNPAEPMTALNQPQLYVSEHCRNLIWSLKEWTGLDGDKGASKDPIDCLRYLATEDPQHIEEGALCTTKPRSY